jgi:exosortase
VYIWEWVFALLLLVVFAPAVAAMSEVWSRLDYYSHGYLVPVVALWIAAGQRRLLADLPRQRDPRGLALLAVALTVYGLALGASVVSLQGIALVVATAAAVLYLRGSDWLRALGFSIAYLLFMVPIPGPAIAPLVVKLQLFVTSVGVQLLQFVNVPVLRNGTVIQLPGDESLFVAEACSGITSIVTLLPLAVILAYYSERSLARRAVLVAAVVPLAMLGNLIRVIATVLVARSYGVDVATGGFLHESAGLATYVLGCLALLAVGMLMRLVVPEKPRIPAP